jgi:hypothetical protein
MAQKVESGTALVMTFENIIILTFTHKDPGIEREKDDDDDDMCVCLLILLQNLVSRLYCKVITQNFFFSLNIHLI